MERFFSVQYAGGPFELFGPGHLAFLALVAVAGFLFIRAGRQATPARRVMLRRLLASVLLLNEAGWHVWAVAQDHWVVQKALPLQLCGAMVWVTGFAFLGGSRKAFPFIYFFGIAGALQGVLTPDAGPYGLPHYVAVETLFSHSGLVIAGVWVAAVEGFRPSFRHLWMLLGTLNAAALAMYFLNSAIGSNYLFVNAKPPNASIVDLMPEWPWYILVLEVVAFALFLVLYLPFARRSRPASAPFAPVRVPD